MWIFLVIAAVGGLALGATLLTPATMGVGFIGGGAVIAILARIAQAEVQHAAQMRLQVEQMTMLKALRERERQAA